MPILRNFLKVFQKLFKSSPKKKITRRHRKSISVKKRLKSKRLIKKVRKIIVRKVVTKKKPVVKIRKEVQKKEPKIIKKPAVEKVVVKEKLPPPTKEILIAQITHYFPKIQVVVLRMSGVLRVNEEIHIKGKISDFKQVVSSMQIESVDVKMAKKNQLVGLKVEKEAHVGDKVYRFEIKKK